MVVESQLSIRNVLSIVEDRDSYLNLEQARNSVKLLLGLCYYPHHFSYCCVGNN